MLVPQSLHDGNGSHHGGCDYSLFTSLFCFANFGPVALSYWIMSAYSDGIEYSAGVHLGNNFTIALLLPIAAINGGLNNITITWSMIAFVLLAQCIREAVALFPLMIVERYFSPVAAPQLSKIEKMSNDKAESTLYQATLPEDERMGRCSIPSIVGGMVDEHMDSISDSGHPLYISSRYD